MPTMTPEQFAQLMALLEKLADRQYTITGAADWEILIIVMGVLASLVGFMWMDLRTTIKDNRGEWREELDRHKHESEKAVEQVWTAIKDCQGDCCPREKK